MLSLWYLTTSNINLNEGQLVNTPHEIIPWEYRRWWERRNYSNLQEIICCRKRAMLTFLLDIHSFNPCSAKLMDFVNIPTCKNNPRLFGFPNHKSYFLFSWTKNISYDKKHSYIYIRGTLIFKKIYDSVYQITYGELWVLDIINNWSTIWK